MLEHPELRLQTPSLLSLSTGDLTHSQGVLSILGVEDSQTHFQPRLLGAPPIYLTPPPG